MKGGKAMSTKISSTIKRGQVWLADLGKNLGSEQGGIRPVLIMQNDIGNKYSPTVTICPLTSKNKKNLPTHVILRNQKFLPEVSVALVEQITTIDKGRLIKLLGVTNDKIMIEIDKAASVQISLKKEFSYSEAFNMVNQIANLKQEIMELGKRPRLMTVLQHELKRLKSYCGEHDIDYKQVFNEYKNNNAMATAK